MRPYRKRNFFREFTTENFKKQSLFCHICDPLCIWFFFSRINTNPKVLYNEGSKLSKWTLVLLQTPLEMLVLFWRAVSASLRGRWTHWVCASFSDWPNHLLGKSSLFKVWFKPEPCPTTKRFLVRTLHSNTWQESRHFSCCHPSCLTGPVGLPGIEKMDHTPFSQGRKDGKGLGDDQSQSLYSAKKRRRIVTDLTDRNRWKVLVLLPAC